MYIPYGLDLWSKLYREEVLREVSKRHFARRGRAGREPRESGRLVRTWNPLSLLRRVKVSE